MPYVPVIGHHVRVQQRGNFYNGREAVVTAIATVAGIVIYTVRVGSVTFPLKRAELREIRYGEEPAGAKFESARDRIFRPR